MCLFFYRGKVGLVLTNLNWSGWVLATDTITVRRESLPCPALVMQAVHSVQQSEESGGKLSAPGPDGGHACICACKHV